MADRAVVAENSEKTGEFPLQVYLLHGYGADNTNKLPSAKVATEARYQLRMVPQLSLTCMKNKIKGQ